MYKVFQGEDYPADLYGGWGIEEIDGGVVYDAECFDENSAKLAVTIMNELDCETWEDLRHEMERRGWVDPLSISN